METKFGTDPKDLIVSIGPGIRKDSYIVRDPIQKGSPEWQPFLEDILSGETKVDLVGYNRNRLLEAGVLPENIYSDDIHDTARDPAFYSYYRSVRTHEPQGRFATILGLK